MTKGVRVLFLVLVLIIPILMLTACSTEGREFIERFTPDDKKMEQLTDVSNFGSHSTEAFDDVAEYYDEKTGQMVTEKQMRANSISDWLKYPGCIIAGFMLALGLWLRRINTTTTKKLGASLIILFVLYIVVLYAMAYFADGV